MRRLMTLAASVAVIGLSLTLAPPAWAKCSPDSVQVGPVCIDKYEASVWSIPASKTGLIDKVKKGKATLANLTAGGATQISVANSFSCSPAFPSTFPDTGNWTAPLYAASIAGVPPSACITWLQAAQACALSGKRLVTNQEWQQAAAGTPDPGLGPDNGTTDCNLGATGGPVNTGSRSACISSWGAFDMVGNVEEWVGDWDDLSGTCAPFNCQAVARGDSWLSPVANSITAVNGGFAVSSGEFDIGFRCAR